MAFIVKPGDTRDLRTDVKMLKTKGFWGDSHSKKQLAKQFLNSKPTIEMAHLLKFRFIDINDVQLASNNQDDTVDQYKNQTQNQRYSILFFIF